MRFASPFPSFSTFLTNLIRSRLVDGEESFEGVVVSRLTNDAGYIGGLPTIDSGARSRPRRVGKLDDKRKSQACYVQSILSFNL